MLYEKTTSGLSCIRLGGGDDYGYMWTIVYPDTFCTNLCTLCIYTVLLVGICTVLSIRHLNRPLCGPHNASVPHEWHPPRLYDVHYTWLEYKLLFISLVIYFQRVLLLEIGLRPALLEAVLTCHLCIISARLGSAVSMPLYTVMKPWPR